MRQQLIDEMKVQFDGEQWINSFIDWIIALDLSYRQAADYRTKAIVTTGRLVLESLYPSAPTTISKWIQDRFLQRIQVIKSLIHSSLSKIHLTVDLWKAKNSRDYCGVVASFVSKLATASYA